MVALRGDGPRAPRRRVAALDYAGTSLFDATQNPAQPETSAMAVKRGRIYSVGTDPEILSLKDRNTRLIDAGGRRLIPGLNDAHIHVLNERNYNST
jgi:imidazolonepropionase-like amidohydrolase